MKVSTKSGEVQVIHRIAEEDGCFGVHVDVSGAHVTLWFPSHQRSLVETLCEGADIHFEAQIWHAEHLCLVHPKLLSAKGHHA